MSIVHAILSVILSVEKVKLKDVSIKGGIILKGVLKKRTRM
jgi:hypothetical protein